MTRLLIRLMMHAKHRPTDTRRDYDYTDWEAVERFAHELVLLRQALSNLFRNSVEACGAAGVPPVISVAGTIDRVQQTIALAVTDNGPGIQSEALPRLFQPFFTTRAGGTGLGLAIVRKNHRQPQRAHFGRE